MRWYSRPKEVDGGIKAQTKRGAFGKNWWSKKWVEIIESLNIHTRLARGRTYARKGQVVSIDISKGKITAKVQGSWDIYDVTIGIAPIEKNQWLKITKLLSGQLIYISQLSARHMPHNIEETFQAAGVSLLPLKQRDLKTDCSCPDWSNPCKHIAAVYYIIGEEFDRDPFLIFKLRGMDEVELMKNLGIDGKFPKETVKRLDFKATPLRADGFWSEDFAEEPDNLDFMVPSVSMPLVKRLGNFPLWQGKDDFNKTLENIYNSVSKNMLNKAKISLD